MRVRARSVALLVAYLVAVALFFEGISRAVLSVRSFRQRVMNADETSWRLRWVRRPMRARGVNYVYDAYHPTRGWTLKPHVGPAPGFANGAVLSSNSEGVRGRQEYRKPKPPGVARLLVFGDSFTFGEEVADDETYAAALEALLPGTEVVNLGVHGYGHDQMLLYLQEAGGAYQPDVVLLGFVSLDMPRNLLGFRDFAKPRFVAREGRLVLTNVPLPTPAQVRAVEPFRPKVLDLLRLLYGEWRPDPDPATTERLTAAILDAFREDAGAMGAIPVLAYLPIEGEIENPDFPMIAEEQFFLRYCRETGARCVDLRPSFLERRRDGVVFKNVGHWGPLEHRTAAEALARWLGREGLLPPRAAAPAGATPAPR